MYSLLKGQEKDPRKGARQKKDEKKEKGNLDKDSA